MKTVCSPPEHVIPTQAWSEICSFNSNRNTGRGVNELVSELKNIVNRDFKSYHASFTLGLILNKMDKKEEGNSYLKIFTQKNENSFAIRREIAIAKNVLNEK